MAKEQKAGEGMNPLASVISLALNAFFIVAILVLAWALVEARNEAAAAKEDVLTLAGWYQEDMAACVNLSHPSDPRTLQ